MSRWQYKTATVTVGGNSQKVRQFTAGERKRFAETSAKISAGKLQSSDLPNLVATMGCIDPVLSEEDASDMPTDLLDGCVSKILELSGMRREDSSEKKAQEASTDTN